MSKNIVGKWLWYQGKAVFVESKVAGNTNSNSFVVKWPNGTTTITTYDKLAQSVFINPDFKMT